ncbi:MAG: hypothetical protein JO218_06425 [Burkholderiales bacterium]|nr:hypothetical protein [Burkholderiales bacterium]
MQGFAAIARTYQCDAAAILGGTFLQPLAVVIAVRLIDLFADLFDALLDGRSIACTAYGGRVVLADLDLRCLAEVSSVRLGSDSVSRRRSRT